ncbi:hypothetical protein HRI_002889800 [Hibiscus trionum]|uniref:C2H2-type domain-containing protein n=1 Tax=Hibiscus trionum TaxID=183268 RepID=A0A9W7I987_HIBTR|nr:hypothetical protein HRI_002889800 [Hibiscus trionum]
MAKTNIGSFFNKFISLFILLLHLGCFVFAAAKDRQKPTKKRKSSPLSPNSHKHRKALSSTWTFIKRIFSSTSKPNCKYAVQTQPATTPALTSARNSQQSLVSMVIPPETHQLSDSDSAHPRHQIQSGSCPESDISSDCPFFPLRNDIFPCTACGEIFQKPHLLEQHQATKHAVSELTDGDSGNNIVRIIFTTGWTDKRGRESESREKRCDGEARRAVHSRWERAVEI